MKKKVYRYFFDAVEGQERWLNEMAAKGFRLTGTTRFCYEFEPCAPSEYAYKVEFVADKSYQQMREYQLFLHEMGFQTFNKNMKLNYSLGKIQWRPYAKGAGMIATSPGSINRELLIVEKQSDAKPFALHTDCDDLISYYRSIRNAYLFSFIALVILLILGKPTYGMLEPVGVFVKIIASSLSLLMATLLIRYSTLIHHLKQRRKINE